MKLNQATMAKLSLPPGKADAIFFDDDLPGFGLRLRLGGSRSWVVQYGFAGKQRRMTIGSPRILDLAEARQTAKKILAKVKLGQDPSVERAESIARHSEENFGELVASFLERNQASWRPRTFSENKRYLEGYWKPLHRIHPARIDRKMVADGLGKIALERGKVTADRARASLSTCFSWAIGEGKCDINPVIGTNRHTDGDQSRDRVLSDRELAIIWRALPASDYGAIVKLLILTGQRREEIGSLRWSEVALDEQAIADRLTDSRVKWNVIEQVLQHAKGLISLPASRTKNKKSHDVPLPDLALEVLNARAKQAGRDTIFGDTPEEAGFQGWSKCKIALDNRIANLEDQKSRAIAAWRLHDIRRTVSTGMADLGVQPHIIEAVINHISGHKAGVAGVYNRSSYPAEKAAALELWGRHVEKLITDDDQRIVPFPARAGK